jgi:nicotinate-nucleotide pyrophosphorylase (carboxylating)
VPVDSGPPIERTQAAFEPGLAAEQRVLAHHDARSRAPARGHEARRAVAAAGGITAALRTAAALQAGVDIQIEVETLDQLREALDAGAKSVLLDNFTLEQMHAAVALTDARALLEVSGGVTLDRLPAIAASGVDRISVGALTKDVRAIDFSLRLVG